MRSTPAPPTSTSSTTPRRGRWCAALVEQRAGGQKRLPTGNESPEEPAREEVTAAGAAPVAAGGQRATQGSPSREDAASTPPAPAAAPEPPSSPPVTLSPPPSAAGPRRPARYGLTIDFEHRPDFPGLGRLVESTVLVNTAHPAYLRAVASRSEGYHAALAVGMALADVAVEPAGTQAFLATFLARWGEAVGRDRRRRQPRGTGRPEPA